MNEGQLFQAFVELVRILRAECPWDKKQTHTTLMPLLLEEVYETIEAAESHHTGELAKELGDILLHVVMNAVIAEESSAFSIADVIRQEFDKLVARHPHVFGDAAAATAEDVKRNWEHLKMQEGRRSVVEGVPKHLPALLRATRIQEKVAAVGFDWDNSDDAFAKVSEELHELRSACAAYSAAQIEEELGDVLFALVNFSRFLGVNAEQALQKASDKFMRRFQRVEELATGEGKHLHAMSLVEMDMLWNQAKAEE
ncbi:MAG: nucleoside triphosphate pyrophosphohydrolase [Candidatus Kapabacteria bacterium]|nr:nucleoside triphosphate pyrophosphohydrolase [Candidatus Kapabacteria bacterium]